MAELLVGGISILFSLVIIIYPLVIHFPCSDDDLN